MESAQGSPAARQRPLLPMAGVLMALVIAAPARAAREPDLRQLIRSLTAAPFSGLDADDPALSGIDAAERAGLALESRRLSACRGAVVERPQDPIAGRTATISVAIAGPPDATVSFHVFDGRDAQSWAGTSMALAALLLGDQDPAWASGVEPPVPAPYRCLHYLLDDPAARPMLACGLSYAEIPVVITATMATPEPLALTLPAALGEIEKLLFLAELRAFSLLTGATPPLAGEPL